MEYIAKEKKLKIGMTYIWSATLLIAIGSGVYLYSKGYRFKDNLTLGKNGKVSMTIQLADTAVFIDNSQKIKTTKENEKIDLTLSPRTHSVIVAKDGYFPWTKDFSIPSEGNLELHPILVSQNASGQIITDKDPEYFSLRNSIIKNLLPTRASPASSSDKKSSLWVEDNAIIVKGEISAKKIIQPDTIVKNVAFYKDRNDAVMFSTTNTIYVIEADTNSVQNFMPVYRGTDPEFIKTDSNFIYVLDGTTLMQVRI